MRPVRHARVALTDVRALATYAVHYGNCDFQSWDDKLTACKCGLFALLTRLERDGVLKKEDERERAGRG